MIKDYQIKLSYNDISIVPSILSQINHRSECIPYDENGMLPIFTAPMSCIINENNFDLFEKNKIYGILPRNISFSTRMEYALQGKWASFSLNEFEQYFCNEISDFEDSKKIKVLIDVANGHMKKLYDLVKKSKSIFKERISIMLGNIANPETYHIAVESGVDYIRCSIGTGNGCITSSNTSIHYPIASLIDEISKIKAKYDNKENITKIIADGGIRNYNDVIKALALGADYVMIGGLFSSFKESCGEKIIENKENGFITLTNEDINRYLMTPETKFNDCDVYTIFYGMASKKGQEDINGKKTKTSEGITKKTLVRTTIQKWSENMKDYLCSAMSYTNSKTLDDLKKSEVIIISNNTINSINK